MTPAERATDGPRMEADAPAEILDWHLEIDDRDYPKHRTKTEYIRFKVFDPDKAASITRVSRLYYSTGSFMEDKVDIRARLTLPDGTVHDFGEDAVTERTMAREAAVDSWSGRLFGNREDGLKEKFLAITGMVAGAVLDYRITEVDSVPPQLGIVYVQRDRLPIRRFEYQLRTGSPLNFAYDQFAFNNPRAKLTRDPEAGIVTITAELLPSLPPEPFSGARMDTAFTIVNSCVPLRGTFIAEGAEGIGQTFSDKAGPWAVYASITTAIANVMSEPTRKVRARAEELVTGAGSDLEKARRLHAYVQERYQSFLRLPRAHDPDHRGGLDDLMDDSEVRQVYVPDRSFIYLELGLARAVKLPVHVLLLPDRDVRTFDPRVVCWPFLDDLAVGYKIGDEWHVSFPVDQVVHPFDELPWQHENVPALVGELNKQDFIQAPALNSGQSTVQNFAVLKLSAAGDLDGECRTYYSGHQAAALRRRLRKKTQQEQHELLAKEYRDDLQAEKVDITGIAGTDTPDQPLEVNYSVHLPGFAVAAGDRLLFKPFIFRWHAEPRFTAEEQKHMVVFPYRWAESDRVLIQLPRAFAPETKESPASYPGPSLSHKASVAYDPKSHTIQSTRTWVTNTLYVPVESYRDLKAWCAAVATSDRTDMVLVRAAATTSNAQPARP